MDHQGRTDNESQPAPEAICGIGPTATHTHTPLPHAQRGGGHPRPGRFDIGGFRRSRPGRLLPATRSRHHGCLQPPVLLYGAIMSTFESTIEALEHQWMRAWVQRDRKTMKSLASRDFIFLLGSDNAAILDRASWLEAAGARLVCDSYRLGSLYVRRHGNIAVFASAMTIEARIDGEALSGTVWVVDLWKKTRLRRRWRLLERTLARPDTDARLPGAVRAMQLWR